MDTKEAGAEADAAAASGIGPTAASTPPLLCFPTRPAVWSLIRFFYALGNTPPRSLLQHTAPLLSGSTSPTTRCLLLGCGDLRHLLFTAHCRQTFQQSSATASKSKSKTAAAVPSVEPIKPLLDCTLVDIEPAVHARNALLLAAIATAQDDETIRLLWPLTTNSSSRAPSSSSSCTRRSSC